MRVGTQVERQSRELARENGEFIRAAARIGYVARGVLYVVIGVLTMALALGRAREEADKSGALKEIGSKPMGRVLLVVLAAAFAAFMLWQFIEAAFNFEDHGIWTRLSRVARALVYASMTWATVTYALDSKLESGDQQSQDATAKLLEWPLGPWLVAALGLVLIGVGAYSGRQATGERFEKRLKRWEISREVETAIGVVARVGLLARMVVFALVGGFIVRAAVTHSSREATGLDGALRRLAELPYGRVLLGVLAIGLVAFGVYCFVEAKYRRIQTS